MAEIDPRQVTYMRLEELEADPRNPKAHDEETIDKSIGRFGMLDPIVQDQRTGYIVSGHGRHKALTAMQERGETAPEGVKTTSAGEWLVPVVTGWASRTDTEAAAALVALNRTTELGGWVDDALLDILEELSEVEDGLSGVGFDDIDLESLNHRLDEIASEDLRAEEYTKSAKEHTSKRVYPIDLIFSSSASTHSWAQIAYTMGWNPGIITSAAGSARLYLERFPKGKPIMFMDNEYQDYNHAQHVAALKEFRPKYATVRDLVTREQAEEIGIPYYTVEDTLEMAAEIAQYCENVILIPKYDCLDKLPREINGKRVVLGYSVQASYGATPLPASRLKGWPVHLLGGSWKRQRSLLNVLGDDVVSLDNNQAMKVAQFGQVWLKDGEAVPLNEILSHYVANHATVSLVLSLSNMIDAIVEDFGVESVREDIEEIEASISPRDDEYDD